MNELRLDHVRCQFPFLPDYKEDFVGWMRDVTLYTHIVNFEMGGKVTTAREKAEFALRLNLRREEIQRDRREHPYPGPEDDL